MGAFWHEPLVFFLLIILISPNSLKKRNKQSISCWVSAIECVATPASSANSISLTMCWHVFLLALKWAILNRSAFSLVWIHTPSELSLKATFNMAKRYKDKSVGAKTQTCLTPSVVSAVKHLDHLDYIFGQALFLLASLARGHNFAKKTKLVKTG